MWMDAERDEEEQRDGAPGDGKWQRNKGTAYWRRRFFILCGGVAALGVCAWLFPGAHTASRPSAAAQASMAALASRQTLPPAAYGSAWPGATPSSSKTAKPSPSASPSASPTASRQPAKGAKKQQPTQRPSKQPSQQPSRQASPSGRPSATRSSTPGAAGTATCAPADIVLSLFTGQSSYAQDALPKFSVYAVSTAAAGCMLTYGPGAVQVVVTWHGRVVWDSAACKPPAAKPVKFTLGVPQVMTATWDRKATKPAGCAGSLSAGAWGTFDVVAMSHGESSPVRTFKLAR